VGLLWNSAVLVDGRGVVRCHSRKLVPTFWEKLVWASGDGVSRGFFCGGGGGWGGGVVCLEGFESR
jgi:nitrilase